MVIDRMFVDSLPGPRDIIGLAWQEAESLGWSWPTPWGFTRPNGLSALPLTGGPAGWWDHELREGIRLRELSKLHLRRPELQGVQLGIDKEATLSLLRRASDDWEPARINTLHAVLAASPKVSKQLHAANVQAREKGTPIPFPDVLSPICPWCDLLVIEDHAHLYWSCPRWAPCREPLLESASVDSSGWHPCTRNAGIMVQGSELDSLVTCLPPIDNSSELEEIQRIQSSATPPSR